MRRTKYILIFVLLFSLISCSVFAQTESYSVDIKNFTSVSIQSGFNFKISQSDEYNIEVNVSSKIKNDIVVEQVNNTLKVYRKPNIFRLGIYTMEVFITMPNIKGLYLSGGSTGSLNMDNGNTDLLIEMSGGGRLVEDVICGDNKIDISGGATIKGTLTSEDLVIDASGGSKIELSGNGSDLIIEDASGGSNINLKNFKVKNATVNLSGGSKLYVTMNGTLNAEASGGSAVYYYGNVKLGEIDLSGGSKVEEGN